MIRMTSAPISPGIHPKKVSNPRSALSPMFNAAKSTSPTPFLRTEQTRQTCLPCRSGIKPARSCGFLDVLTRSTARPGETPPWGAKTRSERQKLIHLQRMIESPHPYAVDPAAALCRRRRLRESSPDFSGDASLEPVRDHVVDDAVLLRFLCGHEVVALHVPGDLLERLPGVLGDDLLHAPLERDRLAGMDLDVACLPLQAAPELVEDDLRVRERHPLAARAGGEQQRAQRHRAIATVPPEST